MKINDNREKVMQSFRTILRIGEIFEYANKFYMTVTDVADDEGNCYNVVCLNNGESAHFNNEQVQVLKNVALEIH